MAEKTTNECSTRTVRTHVHLIVSVDEPRNAFRNTGCLLQDQEFVATRDKRDLKPGECGDHPGVWPSSIDDRGRPRS